MWVFEYPAHYLLLKNPEAGGNVVKGMPHSVVTEFTDETLSEFKEYKSDCPKLGLVFEDGKYLLQCVNWTPGPGPGDFELTFETAEAAVTFALSYFFSPNIYRRPQQLFRSPFLITCHNVRQTALACVLTM